MIAERLGHVRVVGRPLEQHVFEQVGHAGLAVSFVAGPDKDGQVDRHFRLGGIGKEEDAEAVVEFELGDPLDGRDELGVCSNSIRGCRHDQSCDQRKYGDN